MNKADEIWREWIDKGEYDGAIKELKNILAREEDQIIRNNLGLAYFMSEQYKKCLETLTVNLEADENWNPYAYSLVSMSLIHLDKPEKARYYLERAVADFKEGTKAMKKSGVITDGWREYTVIILRAAGVCDDHRMVYELFREWQSLHIHWESAYLGGVAAFNLKKYRQAAKYWASISRHHNLWLDMQRIALLVELGKIPGFIMDYNCIDIDDIKKKVESDLELSEKCSIHC